MGFAAGPDYVAGLARSAHAAGLAGGICSECAVVWVPGVGLAVIGSVGPGGSGLYRRDGGVLSWVSAESVGCSW